MASRIIGPLFKWFGSKWLSARTLPSFDSDWLVEPFAGGAGYSLRHYEKRVILCENDPHLRVLWPWLIRESSEALIREIPINLKEGTDIRKLGLSIGQATLLKSWQRTNNVGDCWTISPWGNKPGQWTANTRARVASEVGAIRHWSFSDRLDGRKVMTDWQRLDSNVDWFIDPPYQYNYKYRQSGTIDYADMAKTIRSLPGHVVVCEAKCQKTGKVPDWLPFEFFGSRVTSRRKIGDNHHSQELIWVNG